MPVLLMDYIFHFHRNILYISKGKAKGKKKFVVFVGLMFTLLQKIKAVKRYNLITGGGLKEALRYVEIFSEQYAK